MKINDRGNIKWSAMMLPEHKERLASLFQGQNKVQRPTLDEQKKEEINYALIQAIEHDLPIELEIYEEGRVHSVVGRIKNYSLVHRQVTVVDENGNRHSYLSRSIIDAHIT